MQSTAEAEAAAMGGMATEELQSAAEAAAMEDMVQWRGVCGAQQEEKAQWQRGQWQVTYRSHSRAATGDVVGEAPAGEDRAMERLSASIEEVSTGGEVRGLFRQ